ncbi:hypothetical protein EOD41_01400 [Mucilaginibacter limnophilus]|uniref:DUF5723 domain-containing protein n=1 Tax=Mucilaginibacter limnophilus TaxID=1932778 RepID=A0A437MYB0_9SPHI|nr:DUF5723 family protein [Mucilaginibacter limnophilus]RVU02623.1 hypothetical protein EOD41_01400 [Mucilaginibacter limnophilus]
MKKLLLFISFLFISVTLNAQTFSQYNTETLFDSFENPSQRSFIRDSSNMYASNFFIPNFGGNAFLRGNAQRSITTRLFDERYNNSDLRIGEARFNHVNINASVYLLMLKMYSSLKGDQEIGFSIKYKAEARGLITDETIALFNGAANFNTQQYDNLINSKGDYQNYYQVGFSYREKVSRRVALGAKLNFLMGVQHQRLTIHESHLAFDPAGENADVALRATYYRSYFPGKRDIIDFTPSLRNPGASISLGGSVKDESGLIWQANVKDFGFIHWSKRSARFDINDVRRFSGLKSPDREENVKQTAKEFINSGDSTIASYITPTNGVAELSASKQFWLNYDHTLKLFPSLIIQKQLFYQGFTGALVNHVQYNNLVLTLSASYNDLRMLNVGGQFMFKTPNAEVYIGSERLLPTARLAGRQSEYRSSYVGGDVFFGVAFKFGPPIESPLNASRIPMGEEKGFLGRFFDKMFGKKPKGEL